MGVENGKLRSGVDGIKVGIKVSPAFWVGRKFQARVGRIANSLR